MNQEEQEELNTKLIKYSKEGNLEHHHMES